MRHKLWWSAVVLMIWVCQVSAATHYVGCSGPGVYATINAAIKVANAGDTIKVCPGSYREQVIISKSLTLEGMPGQGLVWVNLLGGGAETTTSTVTGNELVPVIWVVGATVNISNILAGNYYSGYSCEEQTSIYTVGFYYGNGSSGTLNNAAANIGCGAGVWLENSSDVGGTVKVENSVIFGDYFGIFAGGGPHQTGTAPLLRATITGNRVEHYQDGIYLWDIGGTVSNNGIDYLKENTAIPYSPSVGVSYAAPDAVVTGNRIKDEVTGIDMLIANETITSNHIQSDGSTKAGIDMHCLAGKVTNNTLQIRGSNVETNTSVGINGAPANFETTNHFYATAYSGPGTCD